jgi:hypothetical protein
MYVYDKDKKLIISVLEYAVSEYWSTISQEVVTIKPNSTYKLSLPFNFGEYYSYPPNYFPTATKYPTLIGQYYIKLVYRNYADEIGGKSVWTGETISNTVPVCFPD